MDTLRAMARRKKQTDAPKPLADRHKQPAITLRLPEPYDGLLRHMAEAEDRTITAIVQRALRDYARANGYAWPPDTTPSTD
jgi:Ribbon-helix-helix protein, copG family